MEKIILENLGKKTEQEVFDYVVGHLKNQKQRSGTNGVCQYHAKNGLKCAAGVLISKKEYRNEFEGREWLDLVCKGYVPGAHKELIASLQGIHDSMAVCSWSARLYSLAEERGLNWNF